MFVSLQNGDLWGFLRNVNDDYERYESEQQDILKREDELASTFVDKVIKEREREHTEGWANFQQALKEGLSKGGGGKSEGPDKPQDLLATLRPGPVIRCGDLSLRGDRLPHRTG